MVIAEVSILGTPYVLTDPVDPVDPVDPGLGVGDVAEGQPFAIVFDNRQLMQFVSGNTAPRATEIPFTASKAPPGSTFFVLSTRPSWYSHGSRGSQIAGTLPGPDVVDNTNGWVVLARTPSFEFISPTGAYQRGGSILQRRPLAANELLVSGAFRLPVNLNLQSPAPPHPYWTAGELKVDWPGWSTVFRVVNGTLVAIHSVAETVAAGGTLVVPLASAVPTAKFLVHTTVQGDRFNAANQQTMKENTFAFTANVGDYWSYTNTNSTATVAEMQWLEAKPTVAP